MEEQAKDDALVRCILEMAASPKPVSPQEIAMALSQGRLGRKDPPDGWKRWLNPVKQQLLHLARNGRLEILRNGEVVEPGAARGMVRVGQIGKASTREVVCQ